MRKEIVLVWNGIRTDQIPYVIINDLEQLVKLSNDVGTELIIGEEHIEIYD